MRPTTVGGRGSTAARGGSRSVNTGWGDLVSLELHNVLSAVEFDEARSDVGRQAGPATRPAVAAARALPADLLWSGREAAGAALTRYRRAAVALDATVAVVAAVVALTFRFGADRPARYAVLTLGFPLLWAAVLSVRGAYERRFLGAGTDEYRRVVESGFVVFTLLAIISYVTAAQLARGYVLVVVPVTLALTLFHRHLLRTWLYRLRLRGLANQRVLVVGRADTVLAVIEQFRREPQHGLHAVGACVLPAEVHVPQLGGVPVMGAPAEALSAVEALKVDVVAVVSHPDLSGSTLRRLAWALEERGVELVVSPGIVEVAGPRLSIRPVAGLSLLHLERPAIVGARRVVKNVVDRALGGLILVVASPLMLAIALLVKLTSPGPVLFAQTRVGAGGQEFRMLKFRSMVVEAERRVADLAHLDDGNGVLFKVRKDPRVTRVGAVIRRFSLDELPQLLNVLRGDMSLVGPRPPLPGEVARYDDDATRRLRVRPGLTGLWQVSGRSDLSWEESLRLDLRYVDNWTLTMDLTIMWRTVRAVLTGAGAY